MLAFLVVAAWVALAANRSWAAGGFNLSWNDCNGSASKTFACNVNLGANAIIGSFIPPTEIDEFIALEATLYVQGSGDALPPWWQMGSSQCRAGALPVGFDFTPYFVCADPWGGLVTGESSYTWPFQRPDQARVQLAGAFNGGGVIWGGTEWYGFRLALTNQKTVGATSCAGCQEGVTLWLDHVTLRQLPGLGDYVISQPLERKFIYWQGGGKPLLSVADVSVLEGNSGFVPASFVVTIDHPVTDTVRVAYATQDSTATAASGDYQATSGVVTFLPGQTSQLITVNVSADLQEEPDEVFLVNLASPSKAVILDGQGQGTIQTDESIAISIGDVTAPEGTGPSTAFGFTAALSHRSGAPVSVSYQTADGTATAGADYTGKSGILTIPAGDSLGLITVNVVGDATVEPDETFFVNLSNPSNATIADGQGLGTIQNDDCLLYADPDGDGYGSGDLVVVPCGSPDFVANNGDCDDTDPTVHPGAPDNTCDGIDNNCNGAVDEGASGCACIAHAAGVVGWWKGELNANDETGNNNGSWVGPASYAPGEVGSAFAPGGSSGGYVQIPDSPLLEFSSQFTIEGWVYPTATVSNVGRIVSKFFAYELLVNSNVLRADISDDGTNHDVITSPSTLTPLAWSHVATTFNAGTMRLYVNGSLVASKVSALKSIYTGGSTDVTIGSLAGGGGNFVGWIDEVAIYNRALRTSEIQAIYHAGSSGMCAQGTVAVDGPEPARRTFGFADPWPNPAGRTTNLQFQLPMAGNVSAEILDVSGRRVVSLIENEARGAGIQRLEWDGRDALGRNVSPGIYLVRISAGPQVAVRRIVRIE